MENKYIVQTINIKNKNYSIRIDQSKAKQLIQASNYVNNILETELSGSSDDIDKETILVYALLIMGDRCLQNASEKQQESEVTQDNMDKKIISPEVNNLILRQIQSMQDRTEELQKLKNKVKNIYQDK